MQNKLSQDVLQARQRESTEDIRGAYFRDQTKIIHSMPFRRLKHKTQVFFDPGNDHVCTRIEHVMHVATIAATICKGLNSKGAELDEELAFAIGLAHDLGHAPFGHAGETALNALLGNGGSFIHEVNGLRVVDRLADSGSGLNLTFAVRDGIVCHNGEKFEQSIAPRGEDVDISSIRDRTRYPATYEACIVRFSDKIAYLGRDIEDALLAGIITRGDLPNMLKGEDDRLNARSINELILDVVASSAETDQIRLSDDRYELLNVLKEFNYEYIYGSKVLRDYIKFSKKIIIALFEYLLDIYAKNGSDPERYCNSAITLDRKFGQYVEKMRKRYDAEGNVPYLIVADYISGMTDNYALECMKQITIPKPISFDPQASKGLRTT